jgi:two-component system, NtrC family, response regulator GlrR
MSNKSPPVTTSLGFGIQPKTKSTTRKGEIKVTPDRKARILIVDNDRESRRFLSARLTAADYEVDWVDGAQAALDQCVRSRPNLVISDLRLHDLDGLALLKELKSRWPTLTVIIITAHGTIPEAVQATQRGAFGFLIKPVEKAELLGQVKRAVEASTFTLVEGDWRANIVSRSQLMDDRLGLANQAAASKEPVLLTGENGTGKELLARAIHAASSRRDKSFVVVSCVNLDDTALSTRLFGDPAAEDGAAVAHTGALEAARGGTLLLDEIGNLSLKLQVDLLAALKNSRMHHDVRLICTTSVDLKKLMEVDKFRQDLYYHINIMPIEIPPLGRRREDIPLLVSHFLEQASEGGGKKIYSPEAIELLATTDWPGNVRQLFELVKQNVALSHGKIMTKEFVERSLGDAPKTVPSYEEARDKFTRDYLKTNLQNAEGNVSEAARLAKRNRTDFYKLLARYRLEPDDFKKNTGRGGQKKGGDENST